MSPFRGILATRATDYWIDFDDIWAIQLRYIRRVHAHDSFKSQLTETGIKGVHYAAWRF